MKCKYCKEKLDYLNYKYHLYMYCSFDSDIEKAENWFFKILNYPQRQEIRAKYRWNGDKITDEMLVQAFKKEAK